MSFTCCFRRLEGFRGVGCGQLIASRLASSGRLVVRTGVLFPILVSRCFGDDGFEVRDFYHAQGIASGSSDSRMLISGSGPLQGWPNRTAAAHVKERAECPVSRPSGIRSPDLSPFPAVPVQRLVYFCVIHIRAADRLTRRPEISTALTVPHCLIRALEQKARAICLSH